MSAPVAPIAVVTQRGQYLPLTNLDQVRNPSWVKSIVYSDGTVSYGSSKTAWDGNAHRVVQVTTLAGHMVWADTSWRTWADFSCQRPCCKAGA